MELGQRFVVGDGRRKALTRRDDMQVCGPINVYVN